jgi:DNA-binding NarL/FixJ family response regulator
MGRRLGILVLDDDELVARAMQRFLRTAHDVRLAQTPEQALHELTRQEPDVLICDFKLATKTSAEFLRTVCVRYPRVRRVLHSASQAELWFDLVKDKLVDAVVTKPTDPKTLLDAIETG